MVTELLVAPPAESVSCFPLQITPIERPFLMMPHWPAFAWPLQLDCEA